MPDYRIYFKGQDGHIVKVVALIDITEEEAIARGKQYVDGHDIEVWEGGRQVAVLEKGG